MNEPVQILIRAASEALGGAGLDLRKRGWPVELFVDRVPERDTFVVSLRFELPHIPLPIEAGLAAAGPTTSKETR